MKNIILLFCANCMFIAVNANRNMNKCFIDFIEKQDTVRSDSNETEETRRDVMADVKTVKDASTQDGDEDKNYSMGNGTLYIQNETVTGPKTYSGDVIKIGSSVTGTKEQGPVTFSGGTIVLLGNDVELSPVTTVSKGTTFTIENK